MPMQCSRSERVSDGHRHPLKSDRGVWVIRSEIGGDLIPVFLDGESKPFIVAGDEGRADAKAFFKAFGGSE